MTVREQGSAIARFDTIDMLRGCSILGVVLLHCSLAVVLGDLGRAEFPALAAVCGLQQRGQRGVGILRHLRISHHAGFAATIRVVRRYGAKRLLRDTVRADRAHAELAATCAQRVAYRKVARLHIRPTVSTLSRVLFAVATFRVNWFEAVHGWLPAPWTVLWSLSVEEMFYLFFPLLCVGLLNRWWGKPVFVAVLLSLIVFGPFARSPWYTLNDIWAYQSYLGNMDNVAMGCLFGLLAARLAETRRFATSRWPLVLQGAGIALSLWIVFEWPRTLLGWRVMRMLARSATDTTVLGLGVCLIMLGSVLRQRSGSRWTLPVRWLGRCSYEVYLIHELVVIAGLNVFLKARRGPVALWIGGVVIVSSLLGFLLARYVSEPMNRALRGTAPQLHLT